MPTEAGEPRNALEALECIKRLSELGVQYYDRLLVGDVHETIKLCGDNIASVRMVFRAISQLSFEGLVFIEVGKWKEN